MKINKRINILSLINFIFYFESHLDFLAKLLKIFLYNLYIIHKSTIIISILLNIIYALLDVFEN